MPDVSIVILNYNHPEIISTCLRTLRETTEQQPISYEVVLVDNASQSGTVEMLRRLRDLGAIDTLVEEKVNHFFSEGNNIGVRHSDPTSKYILLLNSDVAFLRGDWLEKAVQWMNGIPPSCKPSVWDAHPTKPTPEPRDIVSIGYSYDTNIDCKVRPEGWCCMFRRNWWSEISRDFPYYYGFEEMVAKQIRAGARCGVLSQYSRYLVHREQGSRASKQINNIVNKREPDFKTWFAGLNVETLDFTLGPLEHDSYLVW